jgi:hypothetical protein
MALTRHLGKSVPIAWLVLGGFLFILIFGIKAALICALLTFCLSRLRASSLFNSVRNIPYNSSRFYYTRCIF